MVSGSEGLEDEEVPVAADPLSNKEEVENIRGSVTSVSDRTDSVLATNFVFS